MTEHSKSQEETQTENFFYFAAIADTSEWKIFAPSVMPSSGSLARSGWGIIPSTLRPSLQMPAMFSSDPLGLASAVTSPLGVRIAKDDAVLVFQLSQSGSSQK